MTTSLVILAAGIGSRYGAGVKQLAKMDEYGHTIMDYSIYDAKKAGFDKVVFIIREEIEKDFKEILGKRIENIIDVEYAFQKNELPKGYQVPKERKKPWGTVPAILSAKEFINEPFLIINADDYYGREVFELMYKYLNDPHNLDQDKIQIAMAGYKLKNTLSDNGSVNRGVCLENENHELISIKETHAIENKGGKIKSEENRPADFLNLESLVSMNVWASFPNFIQISERYFEKYLEKNKDNLMKAEYILADMVEELLEDKKARVKVIPTDDQWIGITYKEDLKPAQEEFKKMFEKEIYSPNLWEEK
ncbi:sugar phosphate nucleotidyltransferase [Anaerococcus hydrogenalis]|uniref:Nucleotidyltransferase n=1 Tax=Anaerococcus hydrogenalis TaxID=33029 RepID=A0A2N6UHM6_9FIRM|nr:sugar phosphate nucleotidyltransferase [Anaerococcus hydrogenalis]MDK7695500.1 sugar phosphate nucleotidyltransferase [Anaerococcus hydrogenalis]MDK7697270.1 sugar phosphate nucleotidyltransferase [Anaerococcus hydrogenalis]MDK7708527.1 sugar phosphate nucleotidyltransferase [Anaerococcus hydrogenalis]PMC81040.1 nucleotidyltransferase [Anaerococcus hydrogenalis]